MERSTTLQGIAPLPPGQAPEWPGRTVLANTPDSWSYQHFLDRVVKLLAHTETWRQEGTRVVSGGTPNIPHVQDVWRTLLQQGGQQQVRQWKGGRVVTAAMVVWLSRGGAACQLRRLYCKASMGRQCPSWHPPAPRHTMLHLLTQSSIVITNCLLLLCPMPAAGSTWSGTVQCGGAGRGLQVGSHLAGIVSSIWPAPTLHCALCRRLHTAALLRGRCSSVCTCLTPCQTSNACSNEAWPTSPALHAHTLFSHVGPLTGLQVPTGASVLSCPTA